MPVTSEQVIIYYIDKDEKNEAYVTEMKIAENGQFINDWPTGFFDKAHELSMELLKNNMDIQIILSIYICVSGCMNG